MNFKEIKIENNKKERILPLAKFVLFLLIFFNFSVASASVVITEIMYDVSGSDTGREWFVVSNDGGGAVDITGWKFFESESNHKINLIDGKSSNFLIPANSSAVVVDNFEKFSGDYPNFSGLVFDSAFSLSNNGEKIILRDSELNDISTVSYSPDWGAKGDGNSLRLTEGKWVAKSPTIANSIPSAPVTGTVSNSTVTSKTVDFNDYKIYANAGSDKIVAVGSAVEFRGQSLGLKKEPLPNARYLWSFGDGSIQEGQNLTHFYNYPGDYVVILNVSSGEYTASDRVLVKVFPVNISISKVDSGGNFVELFNQSEYELNLSGWKICSAYQCFVLPKDTIVLPNKKLTLSSKITGLKVFDKNQVFIEYPNGDVVEVFDKEEMVVNNIDKQVSDTRNSKSEALNAKQIKNPLPSRQAGNVQKPKLSNENVIEPKALVVEKENQMALVGNLSEKDDDNNEVGNILNKWTFGLFGIILVSAVGFLAFSPEKPKEENFSEDENDGLKPEDFRII